MKKAKQLLIVVPEYYLIILVLLAGYTPPFSINPLCIGVAIIPMLQIVFKHKVSGILLGSIFFMVNLFFLGALISELLEFTSFTSNAIQLLVGGLSLWVLNLISSISMIYKYSKVELDRNQQRFHSLSR
ncbi:MAG TPA: hypothetical protein VJ911_10295 [Cryomorphaceae bacterium]|nr:hypothetical protein [Cryomorphaceae bacterium]